MKRTVDYDRVTEILTDHRIMPMLMDDNTPSDFKAPEGLIYLMSDRQDGVIVLSPRNSIDMDAHIAMLPEAKGRAIFYARRAIEWVWEHGYQKITVMVPEYNEQTQQFCQKLGFKVEGINRKSFLRYGQLHDQVMLGLTQEDWICRQ